MKDCWQRAAILVAVALASQVGRGAAWAWEEQAHSIVVDVTAARLPADAPAFIKDESAVARLRYLASEPDRWRNLRLPPMGQLNDPDHFFDVELLALYELTPATLPKYRYDFIAHLAAYQAKHPDKDYGYDPGEDAERRLEWPGFAPYRICELYVQLKSSWRTFNTYSKYAEAAEPGELEACRDNIIHLMGLMSHYVADVAQPLHTTKHYNGWVGPNPNGYVTRQGHIHRLIDSGVIRAAGFRSGDLPADLTIPRIDEDRLFEQVVEYVLESNALVEPLYVLEQKGAFTPGSEAFGEGVDFIKQRLGRAAAMQAALWESARRGVGLDEFRERRLRDKLGSARRVTTTAPGSPAP